jgi:hypothetical protein
MFSARRHHKTDACGKLLQAERNPAWQGLQQGRCRCRVYLVNLLRLPCGVTILVNNGSSNAFNEVMLS